jgi:hypothetical protein
MYEQLAAFYERVNRELATFTMQAQEEHARHRDGWKGRRLSDMTVGLMRLRSQFDNLMPAVVSDAQAVEHGE